MGNIFGKKEEPPIRQQRPNPEETFQRFFGPTVTNEDDETDSTSSDEEVDHYDMFTNILHGNGIRNILHGNRNWTRDGDTWTHYTEGKEAEEMFNNFEDMFGSIDKPSVFSKPKKLEAKESTLTELDVKMCDKCNICFEEYKVGGKACITSCGHILHKECIEPWINQKQKNQCPVCTSIFTFGDVSRETVNRWKKEADEQNKLGVSTEDNINKMSVKEMKEILKTHGCSIIGINEKSELQDKVRDILHNKLSIKEIKKILDSKKISYKGCIEKQEFIRLLEVALLYDK